MSCFLMFPKNTYATSDEFDGTIKHLIVVGDWQEAEISNAIADEYGSIDHEQHGWVSFDPNDPGGCIDGVNNYLSQ